MIFKIQTGAEIRIVGARLFNRHVEIYWSELRAVSNTMHNKRCVRSKNYLV
jgi:hypothetical protein